MEELDLKQLSNDMLDAMKTPLKDQFSDVKNIAEGEIKDFTKRTVELARKVKDGKINQNQAKAILKIRKNSVETVLLSIAGIGLLAAQEALNDAINILKNAIDDLIPGIDIL